MPCTTILVGKGASYDGSTMIARNDDSGGGGFTPKKMVVVNPEDQPRIYESVISHVTIELPEHPLRYTAVPNAVEGEGFCAAAGINEANVAMTATETISVNERVLGADPLVSGENNDPAVSCAASSLCGVRAKKESAPVGIGEEDIVVLVLPYIRSAREGVQRLGALLEQYGTYEMNGIAFSDADEIWYVETIGGHHWMARRVPDQGVAILPNQLSIDFLDLDDALGEQRGNMCSADLKEFIEENHLDLSMPFGGPHRPGGGPGPGGPFGGPRPPFEEGRPHGPRRGHGPEPRFEEGGPHRAHPHPGPHPGSEGACPPPYPPDKGHRPECGPHHGPGYPAPHRPDRMPDMGPEGNACAPCDAQRPDSLSGDVPSAPGEDHRPPAPHRILNTRLAFGTHDDADHVYNTPRAWYMGRCLAPHAFRWDGPGADFTPTSDDIPWCIIPEHKVTVEDVKYILSSHYQDTPFDPYGSYGDPSRRGAYRTIGINRTDFLAILQLRPDQPEEYRALEWLSFASNAFNVSVPFYANVKEMPAYLSGTAEEVSTESFYWSARLIAALADACVQKNVNHIERYQMAVQSKGHAIIGRYDSLQAQASSDEERAQLRQQANEGIAAMLKEETAKTLGKVLRDASNHMKNQYLRSDH